MKLDCEVARDLMPLVLDGTASDGSRAAVEEHVAECEPCKEMMEEMRQEVATAPQTTEVQPLVKKLRRRRLLRWAALVLLGVVLSLVLLASGRKVWTYYYNDYCVPLEAEAYDLELMIGETYKSDEPQVIMYSLYKRAQVMNFYFDDEAGDLYIWGSTTRKPIETEGQKAYAYDVFYPHPDYGLAWVNPYERKLGRINHIYKGAPEGRDAEGERQPLEVIYEAPETMDDEGVAQWLKDLWEEIQEPEDELRVLSPIQGA